MTAEQDNISRDEFNIWKSHVESQELYLKHYQLVCSASIVILMQLGFTFLEVGAIVLFFGLNVAKIQIFGS